MSTSKTLLVVLLGALFLPSSRGQQATVPEPESIGVVCYVSSDGSLKPLPVEAVQAVGKAGLVHATGVLRVEGPHSPFRVKASETAEFVVRLASGTDPDKYRLYSFASGKKNRESEVAKAGVFKPGVQSTAAGIPRDTRNYGLASYKYTFKSLPPGEYAFVANYSASSFGVDP